MAHVRNAAWRRHLSQNLSHDALCVSGENRTEVLFIYIYIYLYNQIQCFYILCYVVFFLLNKV